MLTRRVISGSILIAISVACLYLDYWLGWEKTLDRPGLIIAFCAWVLAMMAAYEIAVLWRNAGHPVSSLVIVGGVSIMGLASFSPIIFPRPLDQCPLGLFGGTFFGVGIATAFAVWHAMIRFGRAKPGDFQTDVLARHILSFTYFAMFLGSVAPLRKLSDDNAAGLVYLIAVIVTVKLADIVAYFFGKAMGTMRLAPRISPNKTMEGAIGAIIGGLAGALIAFGVLMPILARSEPHHTLWWILGYGLAVSLAGMFGDLAESMLKRETMTKDSSVWLPGLGGIWDLIDSLIFAGPMSVMYLVLMS